jgi:group II intron reverse transcriptase/maturase
MHNVEQERAHLAKLAAAEPHKRFRKLYRLLCQRSWLEVALDAIRANRGFNTPGVDGIKGTHLTPEHLDRLAEKLRAGTYQPMPVRRVFILKRNGKHRPLGLPSAEDKVVQSAIKLILDALYEPLFRTCSHGFRPRRSCHTALQSILLRGTPTWTIEGDLEHFFDGIDHGILLTLLRKRIADERFIELIRKFLKAGYLEDWHWHATWSGTPQGSVISPVLANVVLHELDQHMEDVLGANRRKETGYVRRNPAYNRINLRVNRCSHRLMQETDPIRRAHLLRQLQVWKAERARTPSMLPERSLAYTRYADDWLLTLHGYAKDEARAIKEHLAEWLRTTLKLTLNPEKTAITHWSERVPFLGYELRGIKSWARSSSRGPRLLIPQAAEARVRHSVARLTRQTFVEPGDMIEALNRVLRGWMHYYGYATNPHRVFARVLHHAFWKLVRYVNKRHKVHGARKALRRYYGTLNGRKTFVYTSPKTGRQAALIRSIGRKSLYDLKRADAAVDQVPTPWMIYSASVGRSPWQRMEVRMIQANRCAQCANPVEEVHHRIALRNKTDRAQAGYQARKIGLCHTCHRLRTLQQYSQANRESRMLPK